MNGFFSDKHLSGPEGERQPLFLHFTSKYVKHLFADFISKPLSSQWQNHLEGLNLKDSRAPEVVGNGGSSAVSPLRWATSPRRAGGACWRLRCLIIRTALPSLMWRRGQSLSLDEALDGESAHISLCGIMPLERNVRFIFHFISSCENTLNI